MSKINHLLVIMRTR